MTLRSKRYYQLLRAGFTPKEANRFRDFQQSIINELCEALKPINEENNLLQERKRLTIQKILSKYNKI